MTIHLYVCIHNLVSLDLHEVNDSRATEEAVAAVDEAAEAGCVPVARPPPCTLC